MKKLTGITIILSMIHCSGVSFAYSNGNICKSSSYPEMITAKDTSIQNNFFKVDSFDLEIIPPSSGIQYYKDGIVYLARSKDEKRMLPSHISFGAIQAYHALVSDTALSYSSLFSTAFPFDYPCEAITFNNDCSEMFFTKRAKKNYLEKIWQAQLTKGSNNQEKWISYDNPLDFCKDNSIYTHPTLSSDGKILVFASNREGTHGNMDLFLTLKDGEEWMDPVNLGANINTEGNELFPCLDSENNLFFSSDGRKGLGGFDIYVCKFDGKSWDNPLHLTQVINSENDDIAFTINRNNGRSAFYTSRQRSGRTSQLFRVVLNKQYIADNIKDLTDAFIKIAPADKTMQGNLTELPVEKFIIPEKESKAEPVKKEEVKIAEIPEKKSSVPEDIVAKPVTETNKPVLPEKKVITRPEPPAKPAPEKTKPETIILKDYQEVQEGVVYRIQFLASMKPKGRYQFTFNNKIYTTYEYLYSGAYRTCVGEFNNLAEARNMQIAMRKSGYDQAFVAAFRNNVRTVFSIKPGTL
jgi:hypothetical protein